MKNSDLPALSELNGLTKREYFAGLALQGMLSNHHIIDCFTKSALKSIAKASLVATDGLLKELEKTGGEG